MRPKIEAALQDTRVVLISEPWQAGKKTLARQVAGQDQPYLTLDDVATLDAARSEPVGFVCGLKQAAIDEARRAPDLMLAIKESVDRVQEPGRFLLTGSANLASLPTIADSLAGRMEVIPLLPFAQAELLETPGRFLERAFAREGIGVTGNPIVGDALVEVVLRGGYPEVVRRPTVARRRAWLEDYVALILNRDVRDIANIDQLDRLPRLLNVLAEYAGQLVDHSSFGAALALSSVTAQKYVAILERLFLERTLPPWSTNRLSRLVVKTSEAAFPGHGAPRCITRCRH